jgi:MFS family permease
MKEVATYRSYVNVISTTGRSIGGPLGGYIAQRFGWRWSVIPTNFVASAHADGKNQVVLLSMPDSRARFRLSCVAVATPKSNLTHQTIKLEEVFAYRLCGLVLFIPIYRIITSLVGSFCKSEVPFRPTTNNIDIYRSVVYRRILFRGEAPS